MVVEPHWTIARFKLDDDDLKLPGTAIRTMAVSDFGIKFAGIWRILIKRKGGVIQDKQTPTVVRRKGASTSAREHKRGRSRRGIRKHMP